MEHNFRNAMLLLAAHDMTAGDTEGAEMWLAAPEPAGNGRLWKWEKLAEGTGHACWNIEMWWDGDNVMLSLGDYGGGFFGCVKPDLTSEEMDYDAYWLISHPETGTYDPTTEQGGTNG